MNLIINYLHQHLKSSYIILFSQFYLYYYYHIKVGDREKRNVVLIAFSYIWRKIAAYSYFRTCRQ